MKEFEKLLEISNILLGPNGCDWDKKQTFETIKKYLMEESCELVDAIDEKDNLHIVEELGDVLYLIVFISKIAELNKLFDIFQVIKALSDKLIRRHPHIFGDKKVKNVDDIVRNWQEIKKLEGNKSKRKNLFDELPKSLPFLLKVQKIIKILKRNNLFENNEKNIDQDEFENKILTLLIRAVNSDIDIESSIKRKLKKILLEKDIKNTGDFLEA